MKNHPSREERLGKITAGTDMKKIQEQNDNIIHSGMIILGYSVLFIYTFAVCEKNN